MVIHDLDNFAPPWFGKSPHDPLIVILWLRLKILYPQNHCFRAWFFPNKNNVFSPHFQSSQNIIPSWLITIKRKKNNTINIYQFPKAITSIPISHHDSVSVLSAIYSMSFRDNYNIPRYPHKIWVVPYMGGYHPISGNLKIIILHPSRLVGKPLVRYIRIYPGSWVINAGFINKQSMNLHNCSIPWYKSLSVFSTILFHYISKYW